MTPFTTNSSWQVDHLSHVRKVVCLFEVLLPCEDCVTPGFRLEPLSANFCTV